MNPKRLKIRRSGRIEADHENVLNSMKDNKDNILGDAKPFFDKHTEQLENLTNSMIDTGKKNPGNYYLAVDIKGNLEAADVKALKRIFVIYLRWFLGVSIPDSVINNFTLMKNDDSHYMLYTLMESKKSKLLNNIVNENFIEAKTNLNSILKSKLNSKLSDSLLIEI